MTTKVCSLCFIQKAPYEFYKDNHAKKDGYSSACKKCRSRQITIAAKKRRLGNLNGDIPQHLYETNEKWLKLYLEIFEQEMLSFFIIPVWLVGSYQPNIGGVSLKRTQSSDFILTIFKGDGSRSHVMCHYTVDQLVKIFVAERMEILSPEKTEKYLEKMAV